jgi:hypothetical protein
VPVLLVRLAHGDAGTRLEAVTGQTARREPSLPAALLTEG